MYQIYFSGIKAEGITESDVIHLEILPEKLSCSGGREVKVFNMLAVGEVIQPGRRKLRTWQISSVLEPDGNRPVAFYRNLFVHLSMTQMPFSMTIVRKNEDSSDAFGDQVPVVLEDYEFEDREGEIGTLYYKIKLREYIKFEAQKDNSSGESFVRIKPAPAVTEGWKKE